MPRGVIWKACGIAACVGVVLVAMATYEERRTRPPARAEPGDGVSAPRADAVDAAAPGDHSPEDGISEVGAARDRAPATEPAASSEDLIVRVIDPSNRPIAGVPLVLRPDASSSGESMPTAERSGTTDESGYASFAGARAIVRDANARFRLEHKIAFEKLPSRIVDPAALEADPVASTQPYSGSIEVRVLEPDGRSVDGASVGIFLLQPDDVRGPVRPDGRPSWHAKTTNGRAIFPFVELGRTWEAEASRPGSSVHSRMRADGPSRPNTSTTIDIVLGTDHPVLGFRALDTQRNPLPRVKLEVERTGMFGRAEKSHHETDTDGRFQIDIPNVTGFGSAQLLVSYQADQDIVWTGRVTVPKDLEPGLSDQGDMVLAPLEVLVAGRVEDGAGRPVADADVTADDPNARGFYLKLHAFGAQGGIRGRTDAHGRFEIQGRFARQDFNVQASRGAWRSSTRRVREGERDVLLVVSPYATLSGRMLLDDGVEAGDVQLRLQNQDGEPVEARALSQLEDGPLALHLQVGAFVLQPVPVGVYTLTCELNKHQLARIESIQLNENTNLGDIDLRGQIHQYRVTMRGATSSENLTGEIAWRASASRESWTVQRFRGDHATILSPVLEVDVWVRPQEYRHALLEQVSSSREIELVAPLHVRLVLTNTVELPRFPNLLRPDLRQGDVSIGAPQGSPYLTDEQREVAYSVSAPGPARVHWHLVRQGDGGSFSHDVLRGHELEINVADVAREQVFPIELDSKALQELPAKRP